MIMPQNKNKSVSVRKTDAAADNKKSENKPQAEIRFKKDNLVTLPDILIRKMLSMPCLKMEKSTHWQRLMSLSENL